MSGRFAVGARAVIAHRVAPFDAGEEVVVIGVDITNGSVPLFRVRAVRVIGLERLVYERDLAEVRHV